MERPIYETLKKIDTYPFHMPGHKRNKSHIKNFYEFIDLDFTEIDKTDNMHNPKDIIDKSMKITSDVFGSDKSYFLVNGSSSGIVASLMASLKKGDYILVPRNCHISVYNGIIMSGAVPIYINPIIKNGIACGIDDNLIKKIIDKVANIKACILTSPTYEGLALNIEKISKILHEKDILLIVDEAHGASFVFSDMLPKTALSCGADIVVQSFHKTLPSLTQCAVLHTKNNFPNKSLLDEFLIQKFLTIMQTTSPSYIFMMSIEYSTWYMNNFKDEFKNYLLKLLEIRKKLKKLHKIKILDIDFLENTYTIDFDITRLTFFINSDVNGEYVSNELKKRGIELEMSGSNHIIAISTICDTFESLDNLENAIIEIDKNIKFIDRKNFYEINSEISIGNQDISQIFHEKKYEIELDYSVGKRCADFIVPYPPGIPIVMLGEVLTIGKINYIKDIISNNIEVLGINNNKIYVLRD